ncbi:hypothetical protein FKM82_031137 [Ascaphus truei]
MFLSTQCRVNSTLHVGEGVNHMEGIGNLCHLLDIFHTRQTPEERRSHRAERRDILDTEN